VPIDLSVVIPVFNESRRLGPPLREMARYLAEQSFSAELIVVDDGSRDGTFDLVCALAPELPIPLRALRYAENRGKGHAIKVGFDAARGDRILFSDVDLSTPIESAADLLASLDAGADIVVGSRKMSGAMILVRQPRLRETLGRVFTALVRWGIANVSDATCGFKAFRAEVGRDIFSRVRIDDWSFDAEVLFLADLLGYGVVEVPVRWRDEAGTKVDLRRDVVNSLVGLARIRLNALRGRYAMRKPVDVEVSVWESGAAASDGTGVT